MKTTKAPPLLTGLGVGMLTVMLVAQEAGNPDQKPSAANAAAEQADGKTADPQPVPSPAQEQAKEQPAPTVPPAEVATGDAGEKGLRLNFRGVPLEMVLNYL